MKTSCTSFPGARIALPMVVLLIAFSSPAAFVYETTAEFLTAGDFNGDGVLDVLVLDKVTGNARVGYCDTSTSALIWSSPLVTGVEHATGCAAGRFLNTVNDVLAVTAPDLNQINLVSLADTNAAGAHMAVTPAGLGPHTLVTLANPFGGAPPGFNFLLAASSFNAPPNERLDLLAFNAGGAAAMGQFDEAAPFERGNALQLSATSGTFAAGLLRGANDAAFLEAQRASDTNLIAGITNGITDILQVWQFTGAPAPALLLSNLAPGSDYVFGLFNGETLPRFAFYVSGQSNLVLQPLVLNGAALAFGTATSFSFAQAIQHVFYLDRGADGSFIIQFGDDLQALNFPGGAPSLGAPYSGNPGTAGNLLTGVVPLGNGLLALLDSPAGNATSIHSQTVRFDGTNYSSLSVSNLPALTSGAIRANAWLFDSEPFVNPAPRFFGSLSLPDWTDLVSVGSYGNSAQIETDAGPDSGLRNPTFISIAAAPPGANYAVPNQVDERISIFSYAASQTADLVSVRISPPGGSYPGPTGISFFTAATYDGIAFGDHVLYQLGPSAQWREYFATFSITNDVTIHYYGTNASSAGRSRLLSATYNLGNPAAPSTPASLDPGDTNNIPVNTNFVHLSTRGTLFYGRRSNAGTGTVWAINLDGTDDTYITQGARPRASRDGRYLAFLRDGSPFSGRGNIWRRDLVTGQEDLLLVNTDSVVGFDWFADDSALLADFGCRIIQLNTNTTYTTYVAGGQCYDNAPVLSQIDGRIAFHNASNAPAGLFVAAADGSGRTNILGAVAGAFPAWPAWSHDGAQLAFGQGPGSPTMNLYLIGPQGTGLAQLTGFSDPTNGFPFGAIWSPADTALIGAATIHGTNGLWKLPLNPDRTACACNLRLLRTSPGDPIDFAGTIVVAPATLATPGLFIRLESDRVVVYWRIDDTGFTLEAAAGLTAPLSWTPVAGPVDVAGIYYEYAEPRGALQSNRFFRLRWTGAAGSPAATPSSP